MFKPTVLRKAFRFRKFSRKAYAAFMSLHREVTIGCVSAHIADREMLKAGRSVAVVTLLFSAASLFAVDEASPNDELANQLRLEEVQVTAERAEVHSQAYRLVSQISHEEIQALPIQTVADILNYLPGLDVRTRGANGSQADVSMRGGTFDQVLVMINGVNLTDAHTGHYSLNLPISTELIERVEILQGTSVNLFGLNAFSGAINIITKKQAATAPSLDLSLRITGGMNELLNPALSLRSKKDDWQHAFSCEYSRANGYSAPSPSEKEKTACDNSDYQILNLYYLSSYRGLDLQLGAQYKNAGAGMFYGFGSQDQFDATRTAFGSLRYQHQWGRLSADLQAAYRANYDRYEWHRGQRLYGNFHLSQITSASAKLHVATRVGKTSVGIELRNENLHSTNLGDTINPDGQVPNQPDFDLKDLRLLNLRMGVNRLNINYFAEQAFFYNGLAASIGVSGNWNNQYGSNVSGGANIGYEYAPDSKVYFAANRSLRLPSFTDLYYNAGNQLGNRDLKPEVAWTLSLGTKYHADLHKAGKLHLAADAYYRFGRNIIDWVYTPADTKRPFHAQNWNEVDASGVEGSLHYELNEWLRAIKLSYAYTWLNLDVNKSGSRYLDYLSHKMVLTINHAVWHFSVPSSASSAVLSTNNKANRFSPSHIGCSWTLSYQQREGQFNNAESEVCDYSPVLLLDGQVYWQSPVMRVALECTNMTNRHYYDYGGILQPGAWLKATVVAYL